MVLGFFFQMRALFFACNRNSCFILGGFTLLGWVCEKNLKCLPKMLLRAQRITTRFFRKRARNRGIKLSYLPRYLYDLFPNYRRNSQSKHVPKSIQNTHTNNVVQKRDDEHCPVTSKLIRALITKENPSS